MGDAEFTYDDAQFDISDKLSICGDWITLELSGEDPTFTLEAARYTGSHEAVPVWCFDALKTWVAGRPAALRQAYEDELTARRENRSSDRAQWARQFLPAAE